MRTDTRDRYRIHWLAPYPETDWARVCTRRSVYPVLLERMAGDGEWEPVDGDALTVSEPDAWAREDTWASTERRLLDRAHVTRGMLNGYAAPAPGPEGIPWSHPRRRAGRM